MAGKTLNRGFVNVFFVMLKQLFPVEIKLE